MPKSVRDEKRTSHPKALSFGDKAWWPQGPDFSICVLLKRLQAVGSLEAKATGAFRRMAANRIPNRMNKCGLKRPCILPLLLIISAYKNSNPCAKKLLNRRCFTISKGLSPIRGNGGRGPRNCFRQYCRGQENRFE